MNARRARAARFRWLVIANINPIHDMAAFTHDHQDETDRLTRGAVMTDFSTDTDATTGSLSVSTSEWSHFQSVQKAALSTLVAGDPRPYQGLWVHTEQVSLLGAFGGTTLGWEDVRDRLDAVAAAYRDGVYERLEQLVEHVQGDQAYTVHRERIRYRASTGEQMIRERRVTKVYQHGDDGWRILHMHSDPMLNTGFPDHEQAPR